MSRLGILGSGLLALGLAAWPAAAGVGIGEVGLEQGFAQGNRYYQEGRYAEAAEAYAVVLRAGYESPTLYLNLGNALFQGGELGEAIVAYTRGLRLDVRDRDLRANLAYAVTFTQDALPEESGSPFLATLIGVVESITASEAVWVSAFLYWGSVAIFLLGRLFPGRRKRATMLLWVLVPATVLAATLAASRVRSTWADDRAVVVAATVEVHSGPGNTYTTRFTLHEGTVVEMRRDAEAWQEIQLTADVFGWVPASALTRI